MYMNDGNKTKINLRNKSVFITGVAGFIGSNLAKRLLSTVEDVKVVGLDNMNHYYERSRERTGEYRVVDLMSLDLKSFVEERKQSELLSYLLSLNFENLKVVQTVMYIGRDYETMLQTEFDEEYDEDEFSRNTISLPVPDPDFVLYEWLRDLEGCKGWKSKRIEAEQVYQKKLSLYKYLERAFRILGIEC